MKKWFLFCAMAALVLSCAAGCAPQDESPSSDTATTTSADTTTTVDANTTTSADAGTTTSADTATTTVDAGMTSADAGTTTTTPDNGRDATDAELSELQTFLNDVSNGGFLTDEEYTNPKKLSLSRILYDGGGIRRDFQSLSEEQQAAIRETPHYIESMPCYVFEKADIEAFLREKADISLEDIADNDLICVEEYDLYFLQHTDTNQTQVTVTNAKVTADGLYVVTYQEKESGHSAFEVTLRKTADGYQFLSNIQL